jgi:hypothetical protein
LLRKLSHGDFSNDNQMTINDVCAGMPIFQARARSAFNTRLVVRHSSFYLISP